MEKKCIFITPTGVSMRLKSGTILMPNTKTPAMATTKEILNALNGGIRVLEIVGTSQIRLDKSNYMMDFNNTAEANASTASAEIDAIVKDIAKTLEINAIVKDIAKTLEIPVPAVNITVEDVKSATEAYERSHETYDAIFGAETKEPEEVSDEPEEVEEEQKDPEAKYYEEIDEPDTSDENEEDLPKDEEEVTD